MSYNKILQNGVFIENTDTMLCFSADNRENYVEPVRLIFWARKVKELAEKGFLHDLNDSNLPQLTLIMFWWFEKLVEYGYRL